MSLACFECNKIGSFNTLIIFEEDGAFEEGKLIAHYRSFYTDCASFSGFEPVAKSRFMIVQEKAYQDSWNTGSDGDVLKQTHHKFIDEVALQKKLPKIFAALTQRAGPPKGGVKKKQKK